MNTYIKRKAIFLPCISEFGYILVCTALYMYMVLITCIMASSVSGHLMNQILYCDWLPEWATWSYLVALPAPDYPPCMSCKKTFLKSHNYIKKDPLLAKLVWASRWLDIGLVPLLPCEFMDHNSISVHKHTKKELDQHPAILRSFLLKSITHYI